ncbi:hypothetical protein [Sulfurovum sp.]|nr:hypothetical protein [Sulfurovum sp.]
MYGQFDLNELPEQIKAGAKIEGKDGVLALHLLLLPKQLSKQSLNLIS